MLDPFSYFLRVSPKNKIIHYKNIHTKATIIVLKSENAMRY